MRDAVRAAVRMLKEGGMDAVKLEGRWLSPRLATTLISALVLPVPKAEQAQKQSQNAPSLLQVEVPSTPKTRFVM